MLLTCRSLELSEPRHHRAAVIKGAKWEGGLFDGGQNGSAVFGGGGNGQNGSAGRYNMQSFLSALPLSLCTPPPPMYSLVTIGRSLRWGRGTELGKRTSSIFQCRVPITRAASEECTNMSSIYFEIKGRIQTKYFPDLMNNKDFPLFFNAIILL